MQLDAATQSEEVKGYQRLRSSRQMTFLWFVTIIMVSPFVPKAAGCLIIFWWIQRKNSRCARWWSCRSLIYAKTTRHPRLRKTTFDDRIKSQSPAHVCTQVLFVFYRRMQVVGPSSSAWTTSTNSSESVSRFFFAEILRQVRESASEDDCCCNCFLSGLFTERSVLLCVMRSDLLLLSLLPAFDDI